MTDHRAELASLWRANAPNVRAYALRHVPRSEADDVVAETFLVACRRVHDVPDPALPWLLVTARNVIRNLQRGAARRDNLEVTLSRLEDVARQAPSAGDVASERQSMLRALAALSETEREALLLTAWDGLAPRDAARVVGCRPATFNVRVHRARVRLKELTAPAQETRPFTHPARSPA